MDEDYFSEDNQVGSGGLVFSPQSSSNLPAFDYDRERINVRSFAEIDEMVDLREQKTENINPDINQRNEEHLENSNQISHGRSDGIIFDKSVCDGVTNGEGEMKESEKLIKDSNPSNEENTEPISPESQLIKVEKTTMEPVSDAISPKQITLQEVREKRYYPMI